MGCDHETADRSKSTTFCIEEYIRFHYNYIELSKISASELLETDLMGLLPLLLLTNGGTDPEVVEQMIGRLMAADETELLAIAHALGGLASMSEYEREWFKRRFNMLEDVLQDSWVYQEIGQQFLERGLEKGRQEERQQELQRERQMLLDITLERFPKIVRLTKRLADTIDDPAILLRLIVKMSTAQTAEEAKEFLLAIDGDEEQN